MNGHLSGVWKYFNVSATDSSRATCTLCSTSYSCGNDHSNTSSFNTMNLHDHLKRKYQAEFQLLISNESRGKCDETDTNDKCSCQAAVNWRAYREALNMVI